MSPIMVALRLALFTALAAGAQSWPRAAASDNGIPGVAGRSQGVAADGGARGFLQLRSQRRALGESSTSACGQVSCPAGATCRTARGGVPLCVCPDSAPNMVTGSCTSDPVPHAEFLNAHNFIRAAVGAPSLTWNNSLAEFAAQYSLILSTSCLDLAHGMTKDAGGAPLGQNLAGQASSSGVPLNATWPVEAWSSEYEHYTYAPVRAAKECAPGHTCGHYTQVVWNTTRSVGCASTPCKDIKKGLTGFVYVCDYYPPGNYLGLYPYAKQASVAAAAQKTQRKRTTKRSPAKDPSACKGVQCPSPSSCSAFQVTQDSVPVCLCPAGLAPVGNTCSTGGVAYSTSLAVYSGAQFSGKAAVGRVGEAQGGGCFTFPEANQKKLRSFQLLFDAGDDLASTAAVQKKCTNIVLWSEANCSGTPVELQPKGAALFQEKVKSWYKPLVQTASASCTLA